MCLLAVDPIEDFSEEDMATGSGAVSEKSPNKQRRTGSEEDSVDIAAILDRAADRFSACMDMKVDSMMDRLEKRIDEKIDSKLGPVMDSCVCCRKPAAVREVVHLHCLTMVVLRARAELLAVHLQYLHLLTWRSRGGADFETETHMV